MWEMAELISDLAMDEMIAKSKHKDLEKMWENWKHKDQYGRVYNISDMTTSHIKNTIRYFNIKDFKNGLYIELSKREPLIINY